MKTLTKDTWQIVARNWKSILLFELLYRGILFPMAVRGFGRGLNLTLKAAGFSYLTAGNFVSFLFRPWTALFLVVSVFVGIVIITVETGSLITVFQGSACYRKLTPFHMLSGGIRRTGAELRKGNWRLGPALLSQYVMVNVLVILRALTHVKPVNFVMQEMLKDPPVLAAIAGILVLLALWVVPVGFVALACMAEEKNFAEGLKQSVELMRGHFLRIVRLEIGCNLFTAAFVVACYLAAVFFAAVCVVLFTDQRMAMAVLLTASARIEALLLMAGSTMAVIMDLAARFVAYDQYGSRRFHPEAWDFGYAEKQAAGRRQRAVFFCIAAAAGLLYTFDLVQNGSRISGELLTETRITAHRGSCQSAPENTMAALAAAVEELADSAEIDVQLTADGAVVLAHDATLKRVAGLNRSVGSLTLAEIEALDVGSWFSADYAGEKIPTLEEVLEFCKGRLELNIEIKNVGADSPLPAAVVELIEDYGMEEQCVVSSVSLNYLKRVRELNPDLRTGYIISAAYGDYYSNEAVDFISLRSSFIDGRLVERVHEQGKGVHAWTVNQKSEMERLVMLGVDGIITDRPVLAREIIYREEGTEDLLEYLRLVFR